MTTHREEFEKALDNGLFVAAEIGRYKNATNEARREVLRIYDEKPAGFVPTREDVNDLRTVADIVCKDGWWEATAAVLRSLALRMESALDGKLTMKMPTSPNAPYRPASSQGEGGSNPVERECLTPEEAQAVLDELDVDYDACSHTVGLAANKLYAIATPVSSGNPVERCTGCDFPDCPQCNPPRPTMNYRQWQNETASQRPAAPVSSEARPWKCFQAGCHGTEAVKCSHYVSPREAQPTEDHPTVAEISRRFGLHEATPLFTGSDLREVARRGIEWYYIESILTPQQLDNVVEQIVRDFLKEREK